MSTDIADVGKEDVKLFSMKKLNFNVSFRAQMTLKVIIHILSISALWLSKLLTSPHKQHQSNFQKYI
jgi:hypothetical protein